MQLYISDHTEAAVRPEQELKGFASVMLAPGGTKTVVMDLDYRSFVWYDVTRKDWYAADGIYEIRIGKSSRDIALTEKITLAGTRAERPEINEHVMIGDLMDCPLTKDYVQTRLLPYIAEFVGTDFLTEMDDMMRNMLHDLPLSSLRSFSKLDNEGLAELVQKLKSITEEA